MAIKWLGTTTAIAAVIGAGAVFAQSQPDAPQKRDESPRTQSPAPAAKDADRPASTEQRPAERAKDSAAPAEPKAGTKEPQRAQDTSTPDRRPGSESQQQSQPRDTKQPPTQQSQDQQRGRDSKQPPEPQQQQSQPRQQQDQQPARKDQAAQPSDTPAVRQGDTARDRGRNQDVGQDSQRGTTSSSVTVNEEQRTQVIDRLRRERSAATTNVNIQVNIGQRLPTTVRPRRLPPDIVRIVPQYRNYEYTIVRDEIIIVDPRTRAVVEVLNEGRSGGATATRSGGQRVVLSSTQRDTLRQAARRTVGSTTSRDTSCLMLQPIPDELARANPEFSSYRYLAIGDQVVIVDPRDQKVVEVIN